MSSLSIIFHVTLEEKRITHQDADNKSDMLAVGCCLLLFMCDDREHMNSTRHRQGLFMPTVFSHCIIGLAAASVFQNREFVVDEEAGCSRVRVPWLQALRTGAIPSDLRFIALSVVCAALPDVDVVSFALDIPYSHAFGHRGFFHSLFFALIVAFLVVLLFFPRAKVLSSRWWLLTGYFFLLTASHGLLDTLTAGGLGIALLAPFDHTRYLAPIALFQAAPLHLSGLFTPWGFRCIRTELCLLWVPALIVVFLSRRSTASGRVDSRNGVSRE